MRADAPNVPPVIDVEAELNYWRQRHADGAMGPGSFGHFVPWIKFACDSLITHPRASNEQREEAFQTQYALQIMPRLTEAQARAFIEQVWDHVYVSSMIQSADRPRLIA
ncbi:hypothetical protein H9654_04520 [Stenotrophomonas sp. Sa5BUN4]|jgi:hypothetical protein|uniref:Uncharacterized protein n=1 Tax=Stenotrophomonas lacuserhaii TaxID=2760084 RepID=A0A8X8FN74_9GAMM|nr:MULTISPECIES: hypothetical protein [Stenotrophomonas]KIP80996.1 hypothetical protein SN15_15625 [Stenotrophomonas maltophilia]MBD7953467.1 hypothetical protein [Stenotrophomonas pennii]MBD8642038.1 hypothetical protein [Stenotrophomonas sp. CFBP 13724]MDX3932607.1 hypothetical protein [Stenotrophomonas sp.]MDY1032590.1 hypothetical protein [Stenotrophomonas sp. CFBP8980]